MLISSLNKKGSPVKFQDIKVGDTVFYQSSVGYGFNLNKNFFLPMKVTKITATQFTCEDENRYQKENGNRIGGSYGEKVFLLGEKFHGSSVVCDQTSDMDEFKLKVEKLNKTKNMIYEIDKLKNRLSPDTGQELLDGFLESGMKLLEKIKY